MMSVLLDLINVGATEVAWDYCLENNICMPSAVTISCWHVHIYRPSLVRYGTQSSSSGGADIMPYTTRFVSSSGSYDGGRARGRNNWVSVSGKNNVWTGHEYGVAKGTLW